MKKRGEGVVVIKDLFAKYKTLLKPPQKSVELEFIRMVGETTNFKLKESQVEYNPTTKTLLLHSPSVLKQELLLNKTDFINELARRLGESNAPKQII